MVSFLCLWIVNFMVATFIWLDAILLMSLGDGMGGEDSELLFDLIPGLQLYTVVTKLKAFLCLD